VTNFVAALMLELGHHFQNQPIAIEFESMDSGKNIKKIMRQTVIFPNFKNQIRPCDPQNSLV
jgi:hypothetical protein